MVMSNGTTTVLRGSIGMSLCPDITPSSSAAMPEQSADVSSTPLHAHAVSWVSTSSTTYRMYSTEQPLCLPVQTPKHTEISSQTDGRKNSRATHPAFFILMTRNRGDAYEILPGWGRWYNGTLAGKASVMIGWIGDKLLD